MKTTIKEIDQIVEEFEFKIRNIKSSNKEEYEIEFESAKIHLSSQLKKLQLVDPLLVPYALGNDPKDILRGIANAAVERKSLRWAYAGGHTYQKIQGVCVDMPLFHDLQEGFNVQIKEFDSGDHDRTDDEHAEHVLNTYLMYMLLSYPRGKVRLNFIDPYFSGKADVFISQLGNQGEDSICRLLQDEREIVDCMSGEMKKRMAEVNRLGDRYYIDHTIYELFVLLDYPRSYDNITESMELLLEKGSRYGIQFVVLHDTNPKNGFKSERAFDILSLGESFTALDQEIESPEADASVHYATDLFDNDGFKENCFEYLRNGLEGDNVAMDECEGFTPLLEPTAEHTPEQYFADVEQRVKQNVIIPSLTYYSFECASRGRYGIKNNKLAWMVEGNVKKNFVIQYTGQSKDHAEDILNQLVLKIMLSLPITKVHVTIINPEGLFLGTYLNKNIADCLVDEINNESDAQHFYSSLLDKMRRDRNELGCSIERHNVENAHILRPYEIIILLSPETANRSELVNLFDNGSNSGIYFIVLADKTKKQNHIGGDNVMLHPTVYQTIDADKDYYVDVDSKTVAEANRFSRNRVWAAATALYINDHSVVTIKHDWNVVIAEAYPDSNKVLSTVIGYESETGKPINFRLDVDNHINSFVIGGIGSGKSRFFHDVILGLSLKYRPEDLELHLLDLKGTEFSCYKDIKHVRTVLVEAADMQIMHNVVMELNRKMDERRTLFQKYGVSDLTAYNSIGQHLPHIVFIVDECHLLYQNSSENHDLCVDVCKKLMLVITQGRALGVHVMMGTQSLNNAPSFDSNLLGQFQDFYILSSKSEDAKSIVPTQYKDRVGEEADRMLREKEVNPGQCFYQGLNNCNRFKFNYIPAPQKGLLQLELLTACIEKARHSQSNGQAFFSGRQRFSLFDNVNQLVNNEGSIVASPGQTVSLDQTPHLISLIREEGQNILTMGYDDKQFVTRTSLVLLFSLMLSSRKSGTYYRFPIINCLGIEAKRQSLLLQEMAAAGYCELIEPKSSGSYLKALCDSIASGTAEPTILTILRQEAYVALRNNTPLQEDKTKAEVCTDTLPDQDDFEENLALMQGIDFSSPKESGTLADVKTIGEALTFILTKGPEQGVHTLMQINKSTEFCVPVGKFGTPDKADVQKIFGHIFLLQADVDTAAFFSLHDLQINELQESEDRLRAYYYNPNGGSSQLLAPYVLPSMTEISNNI